MSHLADLGTGCTEVVVLGWGNAGVMRSKRSLLRSCLHGLACPQPEATRPPDRIDDFRYAGVLFCLQGGSPAACGDRQSCFGALTYGRVALRGPVCLRGVAARNLTLAVREHKYCMRCCGRLAGTGHRFALHGDDRLLAARAIGHVRALHLSASSRTSFCSGCSAERPPSTSRQTGASWRTCYSSYWRGVCLGSVSKSPG
jgi:hypothetical protein